MSDADYSAYNGNDFVVAERSWSGIDDDAQKLRRSFGLENILKFNIADFLELVLDQALSEISLAIRSKQEMEQTEGFTSLDGKNIILREDVYHRAQRGDTGARYTIAHEIGHAFLHANQLAATARTTRRRIRKSMSSESQADRFADCFLAPLHLIAPNDSADDISEKFGIRKECAERRLKEYRKKILGESEFKF